MRIFPMRFVVLCHSRTGSTLFGSLLASHPQIAWGGEYYKRTKIAMRNSLRVRLIQKVARRSPLLYLDWQALRGHRPAYGCKLTPGYVPDIASVIPRLYHNGWRIILLQRRDVFQATISSTVAFSEHHWITTAGRQAPAVPELRVDPAVFLAKLRHRVHLDALKQHSVDGVPHLKIVYEDDLAEATCWPSTMSRVFEYLSLPTVPMQSTVSKTWDRPYQEIIVNYAELEEAVRESELAYVLPLAGTPQQIHQDQEEGVSTC